MAKVCYSCGKKPDFGNARSHSLKATRRRRDPNLQKVRIQVGPATRREWVCTSCLKGFKVTKASIGAPPSTGAPSSTSQAI